MSSVMWSPRPEAVENANLSLFMNSLRASGAADVSDYASLHRFSVRKPGQFWSSVMTQCGVIYEGSLDPAMIEGETMPDVQWFTNVRLNYAENLLKRRDEAEAIVFSAEGTIERRLTFASLHDEVSKLAQALRTLGIGVGDRVCAVMPNTPETIIAMLATTSIGAVWASCSPDFGVTAVRDRFGQIEPKVLFVSDAWLNNTRVQSTLESLDDILKALPSVETAVVASYGVETPPTTDNPKAVDWATFTAPFSAHEIAFERLPFDHPVYIMFSSGTTGAPKCIVHGAGGTLLKHLEEHQLQCDVKKDDRVFYFTSAGWMMWNWLASVLASEATVLLYDGSPFRPGRSALFDFAEKERMTLFGTAAKYLETVRRFKAKPIKSHDLSALRTITSTGSPLSPESFDYVYNQVKSDIHLASISGGTDIIGCFVLGNPIGPVYKGEIQTAALGMAVEIFDDSGKAIYGEKGELVCTVPFPSMPVGFWNDADNAKYSKAYFERFPGVWHHGDYAMITETGGVVIFGRSDAVLNPRGVRIGTAEIYNVLSEFDEIEDSVVIGQDWKNDTRVVLFVVLEDTAKLDEVLAARIKRSISTLCSPHHVPDRIIHVGDIPRTMNGKTSELAVRNVVHNRPVGNTDALQNPQSLDLFRDLPALS